jgi:hypothetical protein
MKTMMQLTGNPFVDAGLATAAHLNHKPSVSALSSDDLMQSILILLQSIANLQKLRVLTHYWQNSPFVGKNLGQLDVYYAFVQKLSEPDLGTVKGYCQICGDQGVLKINRCWLPLAGSADSDPCTLPELGAKLVCRNCFRAILLLPLGCRMSRSGPYLYHVTDSSLQVQLVATQVRTIKAAMLAKADGDQAVKEATALRGRLELLEIASLGRWGGTSGLSRIPNDGVSIISFSNSGTSPSALWLHLPAQALHFLEAIYESGTQPTFVHFAKETNDKRKGGFHEQLCDVIQYRRSFAPMLSKIVQARPENRRRLTKEEHIMLTIYEDRALERKDRLDALERLADAIGEMSEVRRNSFLKQLTNVKLQDTFYKLLIEFVKKAGLKISRADLRIVYDSPWRETVNLLYLLCVAEK